jgi:hypothetical protein
MIAELGTLHFMLGQIQMESKIGGVSGFGKAMLNKFVTKEAAFMPRYLGTGQIYLLKHISDLVRSRAPSMEVVRMRFMVWQMMAAVAVAALILFGETLRRRHVTYQRRASINAPCSTWLPRPGARPSDHYPP